MTTEPRQHAAGAQEHMAEKPVWYPKTLPPEHPASQATASAKKADEAKRTPKPRPQHGGQGGGN